jgi:hypothetical protein
MNFVEAMKSFNFFLTYSTVKMFASEAGVPVRDICSRLGSKNKNHERKTKRSFYNKMLIKVSAPHMFCLKRQY